MVNDVAGVGLGDALAYLLKLPLLHIQIRLDGLGQHISAITILRVGQCVQGGQLIRGKAKTDRLLLHERILQRITGPCNAVSRAVRGQGRIQKRFNN